MTLWYIAVFSIVAQFWASEATASVRGDPHTSLARERLTHIQAVAIKALLPECDGLPEFGANGYLNDGQDYIVAYYNTNLDKKKEAEDLSWPASIWRLAVFTRSRSGLNLVAKSGEWITDTDEDLDLRIVGNGLHVIARTLHNGLVESTRSWKFKVVGGQLRLVGYDRITLTINTLSAETQYYDDRTTVNLLTSSVIRSHRGGTKIELSKVSSSLDSPARIIKGSRVDERSGRLHGTKKFNFEGFDCRSFDEWLKTQEEIWRLP